MKKNAVYRIIDANINRAKEGSRVLEEITRFILASRSLTAGLKSIRQEITSIAQRIFDYKDLLTQRSSQTDIGRNIYLGELRRSSINDIFYANAQRLKESLRVLEEFSKLLDASAAIKFKALRYKIYELEKRAAKKIKALRDYR